MLIVLSLNFHILLFIYLFVHFLQDSEPGDTVDCILQYWSDTHGAYKEYINFSLCESAACTVALPTTNTVPVVASTWRVVLGVGSIQQPLPVNVKALAACLRVDSFFCPSLIPNIQTAMTISCCNVSFYFQKYEFLFDYTSLKGNDLILVGYYYSILMKNK